MRKLQFSPVPVMAQYHLPRTAIRHGKKNCGVSVIYTLRLPLTLYLKAESQVNLMPDGAPTNITERESDVIAAVA
jgi:hypothetical protein